MFALSGLSAVPTRMHHIEVSDWVKRPPNLEGWVDKDKADDFAP